MFQYHTVSGSPTHTKARVAHPPLKPSAQPGKASSGREIGRLFPAGPCSTKIHFYETDTEGAAVLLAAHPTLSGIAKDKQLAYRADQQTGPERTRV